MWIKYNTAGQATDGNVIRHTRFACWITQATNTRLEYVILIAYHGNNGYANAPKCYFNTYIACLVKTSVWFTYFKTEIHFNSPSQKGNDLTYKFTMLCECDSAYVYVCVCVFFFPPVQPLNMSEEAPRILYAQCHSSLFMSEFYLSTIFGFLPKSRISWPAERQFLKQTMLHGILQSVPRTQTNLLINTVPVAVL